MIKVVISGSMGAMGKAVAAAINAAPGFETVAGVDTAYAGESMPFPSYACFDDVKEQADVVIDFSRPNALEPILNFCVKNNAALVEGTTGYGDNERALIQKFSAKIPIFFSRNMSIGVNLQMHLCKEAAQTLGQDFEPEIVEKHHRFKVDAPSGTALMLADAISQQYPGGKRYMYGRYTRTERRKANELGIHSVRGGTIVGEHEVSFIGTDEVVEINHKAYSKQVFAQGALKAAAYITKKQPGLYSMKELMTSIGNMCRATLQKDKLLIRIDCGCDYEKLINVFGNCNPDMMTVNDSRTVVFVNAQDGAVLTEQLKSMGIQANSAIKCSRLIVECVPSVNKMLEFTDAIRKADIEVLAVNTEANRLYVMIPAESGDKAVAIVNDMIDDML